MPTEPTGRIAFFPLYADALRGGTESSLNQKSVRSEFDDCLAVDQRRLRSMARDLRHLFGAKRDALQAEYDRLQERSRSAVATRRAGLPRPKFAAELPVN